MDKGRREQRVKGWLQLVVVVVLVAGAFILSGYLADMDQGGIQTPDTGERVALVETVTVEPVSRAITFTSTGTVQARTMVNMTPQVGGRVVKVHDRALPGGAFEAGQPLFRIEQADFELAIARAKAEVERARTDHDLAKADSQAAQAEWEDMNPDQAIPPLVAKKPQKRQAKAALEAAKADLKQAKLDLERTIYSLPFDGRVIETGLEEGQVVSSQQSYGTAYSLDALEVQVPLREREMDWLREAGPDTRVIVHAATDNGDGERYPAGIKRFGADLAEDTRFGAVMLDFKEDGVDLLPGRFIKAHFQGPQRDDVWEVPLSALQDNNTLLAVDDNNRISRLSPEVVHIGDDNAIVKGTGETVEVIKGSLRGATDGMKVRVRDAEQDKRDQDD